jgi:hypothetical protein
MTCDDFEARIHELLDEHQALAGDLPLLDHAADCPACSVALEHYQELFAAIEAWRPPELDPQFSRRTVRMAFPESVTVRSQSTGTKSRNLLQALALLACVVVIGVLGRFWSASVSTDHPLAISEPLPSLLVETSEAGHDRPPLAWRELLPLVMAARPADIPAGDRWSLLWTEWSSGLPRDPLESLDPWTQGIKPIAASLHTAWSSLRTTFPLYEPPNDLKTTEDAA